jgi:hypothetical protein
MTVITKPSPRELLEATSDWLVREQDALLDRLSSAAERQHAARVEALTVDPAHRSDAKGAASPVRKIQEQSQRDEARLMNVENELRAVDVALAQLDAAEAERVRTERVRASRDLRRREQTAYDALRATAGVFMEQFAALEVVLVERRDRFGGGSTDPEFAPLLDAVVTRSAVGLFEHVTRVPDRNADPEQSFAPRPAPPGAVVPVKRGDAGWGTRSSLAVTR